MAHICNNYCSNLCDHQEFYDKKRASYKKRVGMLKVEMTNREPLSLQPGPLVDMVFGAQVSGDIFGRIR